MKQLGIWGFLTDGAAWVGAGQREGAVAVLSLFPRAAVGGEQSVSETEPAWPG